MADEKILDKLAKLLALAQRSNQGDADAAARAIQRLLLSHNLSMVDLETRGHKPKPGVKEGKHDLGKAAFLWKLRLAEEMAEHYYCHALINHYKKTVSFVGRPDNVESMQMLYQWVIDQIRRLSGETRKVHIADTGEHIDPLRWQVNFGTGAATQIGYRLRAQKREQEEAPDGKTVTALAISHASEIGDFMEKKYGYRTDGRETAQEKKRREKAEREEARLELLRQTDLEAYYRECPWERPETPDQKEDRERAEREAAKKEARNAKRRTGRTREARIDWEKEAQEAVASRSGRKAGDKINLQPFIAGTAPEPKGALRE